MAAADRYFPAGSANLRYRDAGRGSPIVFVHGWALDLDMWEPQADGLCRRTGSSAGTGADSAFRVGSLESQTMWPMFVPCAGASISNERPSSGCHTVRESFARWPGLRPP